MRPAIPDFVHRLAMEPPFRIFVRAILKSFNPSIYTRALWELSSRPAYLLGLLTAAQQAKRQGIPEISAIEFGVAGGDGLLALQSEAQAVEQETGIRIKVYGFDMGANGLPDFIGDYRDHPDVWQPGDYPMDEALLRSRLTERTTLIIGNVHETVPSFFKEYNPPPIGFVSIDVDLYSSARDALEIFTFAQDKMLWHAPVYFDDIEFVFNHRFAGELLAIDEFNDKNPKIKIDHWYGVAIGRPFPERSFLSKLYVAHSLSASCTKAQKRARSTLPLHS